MVANLPYSISGPFLAAAFRTGCGLPDAMALLVQRELADRLAAPPGSRTYGALPATLGTAFSIRMLRTVPPEAFRPRPKVQSAIVRFTARSDAMVQAMEPAERGAFSAFVRSLFAARRKRLRSGLRAAIRRFGREFRASPELLDARAEQLAPDQFLALWRSA